MKRVWIIGALVITAIVAYSLLSGIAGTFGAVREHILQTRLEGARLMVKAELESPPIGGARADDQLRETYDLLAELEIDLATLAGPEPSRTRTRRAWRKARTELENLALLRQLGSWTLIAIRSGANWPEISADEQELLALPRGGIPATGMRYFNRTQAGTIGQVSWTLLPRDLRDASDWALVEWITLDSDAGKARIDSIERKMGWEPGTIEIDLVEPGSLSEIPPPLEYVGSIEGIEYGTLAYLRVPPDLYPLPRIPGLVAIQVGLLIALMLCFGFFLYFEVRAHQLEVLTRRVERAADAGHVAEPLGEGSGRVARLGRIIERAFATLSQEQIFRADAERRAAWEEVARRVAHEVKNPLTPIRLAVDNLQRAAARGNEALGASLPEESAAIREEVRRLERLVNEFHEFARLPLPTFSALEVVPLLRDALEGQVGPIDAVSLQVEVVMDPPPLQADPDLLVMAFTNLARNAVEAMGEEGGTLRARVDVVESGTRLLIEIEDEGPGLAPEALESIFEPYVTGREGGSGLGLAITRRIVAGHGGTIEALSEPGQGALFRIRLPLCAGSSAIHA